MTIIVYLSAQTQLLASPFESSYPNYEGNIMQQETLKVRNFYHHVGLQVANEGQVPDDHIQFELEFILYLLNAQSRREQVQLYQIFLENHLFKWAIQALPKNNRRTQSASRLPLHLRILLKEFLQLEKMRIEGGEYKC